MARRGGAQKRLQKIGINSNDSIHQGWGDSTRGYVENNGLITPRQKFWAERLEEAGTGFALQQQQQLRPEDLLSLPTDAAAARCHCPCSRGVS